MPRRPAPSSSRRTGAARAAAVSAAVTGLLAGSLLTSPGATAAPSEADLASRAVTVVTKDRWYDLQFDGGRRSAVTAARRATTDMRRADVRVDRVAKSLRVTWSQRDLRGIRGVQMFALVVAPERARADQGTVVIGDLTHRAVLSFELDGSTEEKICGNATLRPRWAREQVVATVPFACFGGDRAASVQALTATLPPGRGPVAMDQAPRTRVLPLTTFVAPEDPTEDTDPTDPADGTGAEGTEGTGTDGTGTAPRTTTGGSTLTAVTRRAAALLGR